MKNLYIVLGVSPNATAEQIRARYKQRARDTHPDRGGQRAEFEALNEAYEILNDSEKRAAYDAQYEDWAALNGAVICANCGAALRMPRSPEANETVVCKQCRAPIPIDARHFLTLQKQRLINHAARALNSVSDEAVDTAAALARGAIRRLRRSTRSN